MNRRRRGTRCWLTVWIACGLCAGAAAQILPEARIMDFRIPEYDVDGALKWVLRGDAAQMFPGEGRIRITGARVEIYRNGGIDMVVRAPECDYSQDGKKAWTDGPVEITARNLTIRGRGMEWESATNRMILHHDVRVTVLNPKEGVAPESPPTEPATDATEEGSS